MILLLSGGADSALCLHEHRPALAIGYDYGQKTLVELDYAVRLADRYGVPFTFVKLPDIPWTSDGLVRAGRNAVMIAHAASVAQSKGMDAVMIGCNAGDAERFPDCRESFIANMNYALSAAYGVKVLAPLLDTAKSEIMRRCRAAGIADADTWTCYRPLDGKPCGECYACEVRAAA